MAVDFGQELADLDFENIIGGPLSAVVDAQADAAITSITFIQEVGLHEDNGEITPIMTEFSYDRSVVDSTDPNDVKVSLERHVIQVPVLALLPIPFLRFADVWLDFNVSLNSVAVSESQVSHNLGIRGGYYGRNVRVSGSFSLQAKKSSTGTTKRSYDMHIDLHAVQDDLPEGMDRVLTMLEQGAVPENVGPVPGSVTELKVLQGPNAQTAFDGGTGNALTLGGTAAATQSNSTGPGTGLEVTVTTNANGKVATITDVVVSNAGSGHAVDDLITFEESASGGLGTFTAKVKEANN